jgi:hypothetical protein
MTIYYDHTRQYTIEELEKMVNHLCVRMILKTQNNLTVDFCVKYILNPDYHACYEDRYYLDDIDYVLKYQPHLDRDELEKAWELCNYNYDDE